MARIPSPDGQLEAVLLESNDGTARHYWYDVHIVGKNDMPSEASAVYLYDALRSVSAFGVNLKWETPATLAVEYLEAIDISQPAATVQADRYKVRIILRPGVTDPGAPPGGMLYNLKGRPALHP